MAVYVDYVQGAGPTDVDKANRVQIGSDLELVGPGTILEVWGATTNVGTTTASKPQIVYITLESHHINIEPFHFPLPPVCAHLGATPHKFYPPPKRFVVNQPFQAGAKLKVYATCMIGAPASAGEIAVMVKYTDSGPRGPPVHMSITEPGQAPSTSDNGVVTGSDIELVAARKLILAWAFAGATTIVADKAIVVGLKLSSGHFIGSGPLKFLLNPQGATDATTGGADYDITYVVVDRDFKNAPVNAKITPEYTSYDAGPTIEAYVGVAYV